MRHPRKAFSSSPSEEEARDWGIKPSMFSREVCKLSAHPGKTVPMWALSTLNHSFLGNDRGEPEVTKGCGWERCLPAGSAQEGFYINKVFSGPQLVSGLGSRVYTGLETDRTTADKKRRRGGEKKPSICTTWFKNTFLS